MAYDDEKEDDVLDHDLLAERDDEDPEEEDEDLLDELDSGERDWI